MDETTLFLCFFLVSVFAEGFGCHTVGLLKELVKIGYRRKTYVIANGKNGVVGILQLKGSLLQPDLI